MTSFIRFAASAAGSLILLMFLGPVRVAAQLEGDMRMLDLSTLKPGLKGGAASQGEGLEVALDSPVDPDAYFVGPGDVVALNIWSSAPVEHTLSISPEGVLLIPSIGEVDLRGATLTRARALVAPFVARKYPNATVSLTLLKPRKIVVHITGEVIKEGMFEMHAVQRVDNLVEEANTLPSTQLTKKFYDVEWQLLRASASMRKITVQRSDGRTHRVDLVRYAMTGKSEWNPYLREGDRVFVPRRKSEDNRIGIYGGVIRGMAVEFIEGDSLSHLGRIGLSKPPPEANRSILTRLSMDGRQMDTTIVDLPAILEGRAPDIALRAGDRLVVPQPRDEREGNAVRLEGEVATPGTYPITRTETRLSEIIAMAGGVTPRANLTAATILRARVVDQRAEDLEAERLLSLRTSLPNEDSTYYLTETAIRMKGEVVAADFRALLLEGDTTKDLTLRNFDRVIIPANSGTVYVFGQVISPGHVPYRQGEGIGYYIDRAGGWTNDARTSDTRVIKNGSRAWLDPDETAIEDGDFIWVPKETPVPFGTILTTVAQLATVIAALASVILVANTL
jgi:protein involved in polysaccharide export with SLBB domain